MQLFEYLHDFAKRTNPVYNVDGIVNEAVKEFKETSTENFCTACKPNIIVMSIRHNIFQIYR
jgi:hypothetical protein